MPGQTVIADVLTGCTQCQDFRMCRRIMKADRRVSRFRYHLSFRVDNHRPNGHFANISRRLRECQRAVHMHAVLVFRGHDGACELG